MLRELRLLLLCLCICLSQPKAINPNGVSKWELAPLPRFWDAAAKSTDWLAYHTEFADATAYRQGIAI